MAVENYVLYSSIKLKIYCGAESRKIQIFDLFHFTRILELPAKHSLGNFGTVAEEMELSRYKLVYYKNILRGGAVAARWAHNPKVAGSSPVPATREDSSSDLMGSFLLIPPETLLKSDFARNKEFTFEVRYFKICFLQLFLKLIYFSLLFQPESLI